MRCISLIRSSTHSCLLVVFAPHICNACFVVTCPRLFRRSAFNKFRVLSSILAHHSQSPHISHTLKRMPITHPFTSLHHISSHFFFVSPLGPSIVRSVLCYLLRSCAYPQVPPAGYDLLSTNSFGCELRT